MEKENDLTMEAAVMDILDKTLKTARDREATHIHIEPFDSNFRVRLRIGGSFTELSNHSLDLLPVLVERVKALSGMNIAETRVPQAGRLRRNYIEGAVDFYVQSFPGVCGERLNMHNSWSSVLKKELHQLGMEEHQLEAYRRATIKSSAGLVILTGPTGSDRNSTAYATLRALAHKGRSLATAEYVEWERIPGVNHSLIKEEIGLQFPSYMRLYRRSDLDCVYIWEIYGYEIVEEVVRAVLQHNMLILTCLNTWESISALWRLTNSGIEPWIVSTTVNLVQAQRVLAKLCLGCRTGIKIPAKALTDAGFTPDEAETVELFQPVGCRMCGGSGYRGTLMVAETLPFTQSLKEAFVSGISPKEFRQLAVQEGLQTLRRSALSRLREGQTSLEQVLMKTPDVNNPVH